MWSKPEWWDHLNLIGKNYLQIAISFAYLYESYCEILPSPRSEAAGIGSKGGSTTSNDTLFASKFGTGTSWDKAPITVRISPIMKT